MPPFPAVKAGCTPRWLAAAGRVLLCRGALGAGDLGDALERDCIPLAGQAGCCPLQLGDFLAQRDAALRVLNTNALTRNKPDPARCARCAARSAAPLPQIVGHVIEGGRLPLPAPGETFGRGGRFVGQDAYVDLIRRCWAQNPKVRASLLGGPLLPEHMGARRSAHLASGCGWSSCGLHSMVCSLHGLPAEPPHSATKPLERRLLSCNPAGTRFAPHMHAASLLCSPRRTPYRRRGRCSARSSPPCEKCWRSL